MRILAVEDDKVALAIIRQALNRSGREVVEAADGKEAWKILQREPVRVIVSDWEMPEADGLELCRRIRKRVKSEYVYFILLTARDASEANQQSAMEAGVDDFLSKPLDVNELRMRLRVAERILRYTTQVRQLEELEELLSICSPIVKKSATTKTTGSRWRAILTSGLAASSVTPCAPIATSACSCPSWSRSKSRRLKLFLMCRGLSL